jgi:DNA-binding HxlR family transcriptional regulator
MNKRSREKQCPVDFALGVFGDRWTLLVLRDLLLAGKQRYRDLILQKEGIATNVLASRLKKLQAHGLVERSPDPDDARQVVYTLTDKAIDLIPVLLEISRWSARHDPHTAAPASLVRRFDEDRTRLVAELTAEARARQKR